MSDFSHLARAARRRTRTPAQALALPVLLAFASSLQGATATSTSGLQPGLYGRIASGPLVVHARCVYPGRRASMDVLEVLKGSCFESRIQVSYRSENFNRVPGSPKIEFEAGRESILVLEPEKDSRDRPKGKDRYELMGAVLGKIDLPQEGAEALLAAARRLAGIQAMKDQNEVWSAEMNLLREANPILVSAGFEEILKFRLGDESLVVPLLEHLTGPRPEFRRQALRVLGQMFARQRRTGRELPSNDLLARETLARATGDESPETRAEAVRSLRELRRPDLVESLTRLASSDPSQVVRYEAELTLLDLKSEK